MAMRPSRNRRLFVTGGSGFLGRHVLRSPATERWQLIAPPSYDVDLRVAESVRTAIGDWKPTAIVHTAYRRDDRASIVDASRHVAEAAARVGARLVHVSTDAVFAGRAAPYTEADAPAPVHDYGRHKAEAERLVAELCPRAVIVRTSLLVGRRELSEHERVVRDAITGRTPMRFFVDEVRSPALVDDVAAALADLAGLPEIEGILHLGGPDPLSRAELAVMTARRQGWDAAALRFATLADSGLDRPRNVVLDSSRARAHGLAVRGPASWEP